MRSLVIGTGIMIATVGVWCFLNQGVAFKALAFPIGWVMIIAGLVSSMIHVSIKNKINNMEWLLSEAFITVILGILVLLNQIVTEKMGMLFFGMWMISIGAIRFVGGMALQKYHDKAWKWTIGIGIVSIAMGLYNFVNILFFNMSLGILLGITFSIQSANFISLGASVPHMKKNRKRIEREVATVVRTPRVEKKRREKLKALEEAEKIEKENKSIENVVDNKNKEVVEENIDSEKRTKDKGKKVEEHREDLNTKEKEEIKDTKELKKEEQLVENDNEEDKDFNQDIDNETEVLNQENDELEGLDENNMNSQEDKMKYVEKTFKDISDFIKSYKI